MAYAINRLVEDIDTDDLELLAAVGRRVRKSKLISFKKLIFQSRFEILERYT